MLSTHKTDHRVGRAWVEVNSCRIRGRLCSIFFATLTLIIMFCFATLTPIIMFCRSACASTTTSTGVAVHRAGAVCLLSPSASCNGAQPREGSAAAQTRPITLQLPSHPQHDVARARWTAQALPPLSKTRTITFLPGASPPHPLTCNYH